MIFYKEVEVEEHCLYAREIAELYNLRTAKSGKPAANFVSALLAKHIKEYNLEKDQLYYHTFTGNMVKAYPKKLYTVVMNRFFRDIFYRYPLASTGDEVEYKLNHKTYKLTI